MFTRSDLRRVFGISTSSGMNILNSEDLVFRAFPISAALVSKSV